MCFVSVLSFQEQDTVLHLMFKKPWMDTFNYFELFVFTHWLNSEEASSVCILFILLSYFSVGQNNLIIICISKEAFISLSYTEQHESLRTSLSFISSMFKMCSFFLTKKINQFILYWNNCFIYNKHNYGFIISFLFVLKPNCILVETEGLILHPKQNRNLHYSSNRTQNHGNPYTSSFCFLILQDLDHHIWVLGFNFREVFTV